MSPSKSRRPLAMTLTEVLVYCALLSMFTMLLFISLPTRDSATSEDLRNATSKADAVLERLTLELGNASASSVSHSVSPSGIIFLVASSDGFSPFTYTPAGELAWQGWVGYFLSKNQLVRVWSPLAGGMARTAVGPAPTASDLLAKGTPRVLCDNVESFTIKLAEANLWQIELKLKLDGSVTTLVSGAGARNP